MESLKPKIDRLANTKKPTGDPSCPPLVRRATHIARDILTRVNAVVVGAESESEEADGQEASNGEYSDIAGGTKRRAKNDAPSLGGRANKRAAGAAGIRVKRERDSDDSNLVQYVGDMSKAVTAMVSGMKSETSEKSIEDLESMVRVQIREEIKETNEAVARTSKCVEDLKDLITRALEKGSL